MLVQFAETAQKPVLDDEKASTPNLSSPPRDGPTPYLRTPPPIPYPNFMRNELIRLCVYTSTARRHLSLLGESKSFILIAACC